MAFGIMGRELEGGVHEVCFLRVYGNIDIKYFMYQYAVQIEYDM